MKPFVKYTFLSVLGIFLLTIGFYLWASSPNMSPEEYSSLNNSSKESTTPYSEQYSILTYNIGYLSGMTNNLPIAKPRTLFENNMSIVLDNLKKINPDFIALQEIDYDSDRSYNIVQHKIIASLGYPFSGKNINWDKRYVPFPYYPISMHFGKIISGQSVLSKYPIVEQERIELERNQSNPFYYDSFYLDRLAQIVKIKINGHSLVLINAHLEAFDQETRRLQTEKLRNIYSSYCKKVPTILLGDFNSDIRYDNAGINILMEMIDTGNAAFTSSEIKNTFDSANPSERLDYIFYNTDFIEELEAEVPKEFGQASDHLPVLLTFKFKNQKYGTVQQQQTP